MICPKCNKQYADDEKFCSKCGVELIEEKAEEVIMKCPNCGREFDEDASFCPKCGMKLVSSSADIKEVQKEQIPEIEQSIEPIEAVEIEKTEETEQVTEAEKPAESMQDDDDESKSKIKWFVLCGCLVAAIIIILLWYYSPTESFKRALNEDDFEKAAQCSWEIDDLTKMAEAVENRAQKAYDDYNQGYLQYNEAANIISQLIMICGTETVYDLEREINELYESKQSFSDAQQSERIGEKADAIYAYESVIPADENYDAALSKITQLEEEYKQEILTQAEALESSGSYQEAVILLEEAQSVVGEDKDISDAIQKYTGILEQDVSDEALAAAQEYADAGDYASAISTLSEINVTNSEVTAKLAEYTAAYREEVLTKAEELAQNSEYEQAVDCLQDSLALLGGERKIEEKIAEYEAKYPVHLCRIEPSSASGGHATTDTIYRDVYGNQLGEGLIITRGYREYVADSKYSRLKTTIMIEKDTSWNEKFFLKIYADNRLIYDSGEMTYKTRPIELDLDISGVDFVRFEAEGSPSPFEGWILISDPVFIS